MNLTVIPNETLDSLESVFGISACSIYSCLIYLHIVLHSVPVNNSLPEDLGFHLIQRHMWVFFGPLLDKSVELRLLIQQINHQL